MKRLSVQLKDADTSAGVAQVRVVGALLCWKSRERQAFVSHISLLPPSSQLEALREELAAEKAMRATQRQALDEAISELDEKRAALDSTKARLAEVQSERKRLEEELATVSTKAAELQLSAAGADKLERELKNVQSALSDKASEMDDVLAKRATLEAKLTTLMAQNMETTSELEKAQAEYAGSIFLRRPLSSLFPD